jgi:hypothetical protein
VAHHEMSTERLSYNIHAHSHNHCQFSPPSLSLSNAQKKLSGIYCCHDSTSHCHTLDDQTKKAAMHLGDDNRTR